MKWIDTDLADVWWHENQHATPRQRYDLLLTLKADWDALIEKLLEIHRNKFHTSYTGRIIHDGNRSVGTVKSYIHDYENDGKLLETEGWYTMQTMLDHIRQAEVLIAWYSQQEVRGE